jgi:hypothetical protein
MEMSLLESKHVTFLRETPGRVERIGMHGMTNIINV